MIISSVTLPKPAAPSKFDMKAFMEQLSNFTLDDYKTVAERCNQMGEQTKKAGVQFGYHNHNFDLRGSPLQKVGDNLGTTAAEYGPKPPIKKILRRGKPTR